MKHYFYCAMHKTNAYTVYQNGIYTTNCPPTELLFIDGLKTQVVNAFDEPCSTGQVVILSLSLV